MGGLLTNDINIIGLKPIVISLLPLLLALFLGHSNVYKVLFIMLVGYILLLVVYSLNTFTEEIQEYTTFYTRGGLDFEEKRLQISLYKRGEKANVQPHEINKIAVSSIVPYQEQTVNLTMTDVAEALKKIRNGDSPAANDDDEKKTLPMDVDGNVPKEAEALLKTTTVDGNVPKEAEALLKTTTRTNLITGAEKD